MSTTSENSQGLPARIYFISKSHAIYATIIVAANRAGIAIPRDPLRYDPDHHPHWDFLVRFAQRHALCAGSGSLEERIEEATTTARIYMDSVICAGTRTGNLPPGVLDSVRHCDG